MENVVVKTIQRPTKQKPADELTIKIPNTEDGQWLKDVLLQHARYYCGEGIKERDCEPERIAAISDLLSSVLESSITKQ